MEPWAKLIRLATPTIRARPMETSAYMLPMIRPLNVWSVNDLTNSAMGSNPIIVLAHTPLCHDYRPVSSPGGNRLLAVPERKSAIFDDQLDGVRPGYPTICSKGD